MQTVGKAVEVLDGIAISLEDIGILVYLMRHLGGTLQQEVVVAVYTLSLIHIFHNGKLSDWTP